MWKWSGETKSDHNSRRERTAPLADVRETVRGCREATEAKAEEQIEVALLSLLHQCNAIHHCSSALFSCSSTSREGWEAPILSWQPSAVHSQSHIITTFIFISIDTRPFPPLKLNQRGCRKGGREGPVEREKEGELMMKCRPRPQLIAFQFACKWFRARAGPISWGVNWGRGWETTVIYCPGTRRCRLPWVTKMPAGFIHKSTQKIISCIYELTLCKEYVCVDSFSHKWQHTYQRVNFHRKLVLLVLHRWALMTWQRRRQIGLIL